MPRKIAFQKSTVLMAALIVCAMGLPLRANGQDARKPYSKEEIVKLLKGDVSPTRVAVLTRERGIDFEITPETESELRRAGATDALLQTLRESAPKPPATTPTSLAPAMLVIEVTPGGAQLFVDDELIANPSPEGRLRISTLAPGQHRVRLSLGGYRDYQESVELVAGQTANVIARLEALKPATEEPGAGARAVAPQAQKNSNVPRFLVRHRNHGFFVTFSEGWMSVGNGLMQFGALDAKYSLDSFELPLSEVKEIKIVGFKSSKGFDIRLKNGRVETFFLLDGRGKVAKDQSPLAEAIRQAMRSDSPRRPL